ncbi:wall-associated receptor kinase 3-like [Hordeum vulgare]|nr:wall-associated receptor kinase 3-like [Hordeum vulgare]
MADHTTIMLSAAAALLMLVLPPLSAGAAAAPAPMIGMPGCETRCGDKVVPYPFGMGPSYCYLPGFNLTCDWLSDPPRLLLGDGTLQVAEDIGYPSDTTLAVVHAGSIQTDGHGRGRLGGGLGDGGPYALPPAANQLVLVGCNVRATLRSGNVTLSSCSSLCHDGRTSYMKSGKSSMLCSGMGCCQAPIVVNHEVAAGGKLLATFTSYDVEIEYFGRNRSSDTRLRRQERLVHDMELLKTTVVGHASRPRAGDGNTLLAQLGGHRWQLRGHRSTAEVEGMS